MAIGHGGHSVSSILAHVIQLHSFDYSLKVLFDNIQAEASTPDRRFVCVSLKACAIVFACLASDVYGCGARAVVPVPVKR